MANTSFGALLGASPINWGSLILIPHIRKESSPISPYLPHLYQQNGCVNEMEEDALTFVEDEIVYNLAPKSEQTGANTE